MIELIILIVVIFVFNVFAIIGFYAATDYKTELKITDSGFAQQTIEVIDQESKQLLWFVRYYAKKWLGDKWCKPVACCNICMSSIHSVWYWLILIIYPFNIWMIPVHLFYMVSMVGVQKLISEKFEL